MSSQRVSAPSAPIDKLENVSAAPKREDVTFLALGGKIDAYKDEAEVLQISMRFRSAAAALINKAVKNYWSKKMDDDDMYVIPNYAPGGITNESMIAKLSSDLQAFHNDEIARSKMSKFSKALERKQ
jgi:hypothetical protein